MASAHTEGDNGEHATSVNSTSRPAYDDFLAVGIKAKITPTRCRELYEQVRENLVNYMFLAISMVGIHKQLYGRDAERIISEVKSAVDKWRKIAVSLDIAKREIDMFEQTY